MSNSPNINDLAAEQNRAPKIGKNILNTLNGSGKDLRKSDDHPPSWVRFISGCLGFFSSLLSLAIPAIILLIFDRLIPAENATSLLPLLGLGAGMAISVCMIDLMRMRALERYFTNVRGLVLYQDCCFALFWIFAMVFVHPFIPLVSVIVGSILLLMWALRKGRALGQKNSARHQEVDPVIAEAVGLGPAYVQQSAEGTIAAEEQPDFQTVGQTTILNFLQLVASLAAITICAALHIWGEITLGTMLAVVFLNQFVITVLVRCYQVQSLKPPKPDLAGIGLGNNFGKSTRNNPAPSDSELAFLSISEVEDFGFEKFSADLFQGLCLTLIGPSGSGKSRILRAIATGQFYEGKISYKGQNHGRNHGRLSCMSYAGPSPVSLKGTIVENVTCFDPTASALPAIELVRKLDPYEDVFGDKDFVNEEIDANFGAQGQIVSLARAFWSDSEIIILDSPEMYLDKASRSALMALILRAKTEGRIVIMATDDEYLMSVSDEMVKLERGEVTDRGPMDEVLSRHHQRWVRVSFMPTKRDAFRLSLWLEAQFPLGMDQELRSRVKQSAQDMLFLAPRDQILSSNDEVLFDVRMNPSEVSITMHDRGDLVLSEQLVGDLKQDFERVENAADGFEQTLREGYRQFSVRFASERNVEPNAMAEGA